MRIWQEFFSGLIEKDTSEKELSNILAKVFAVLDKEVELQDLRTNIHLEAFQNSLIDALLMKAKGNIGKTCLQFDFDIKYIIYIFGTLIFDYFHCYIKMHLYLIQMNQRSCWSSVWLIIQMTLKPWSSLVKSLGTKIKNRKAWPIFLRLPR